MIQISGGGRDGEIFVRIIESPAGQASGRFQLPFTDNQLEGLLRSSECCTWRIARSSKRATAPTACRPRITRWRSSSALVSVLLDEPDLDERIRLAYRRADATTHALIENESLFRSFALR